MRRGFRIPRSKLTLWSTVATVAFVGLIVSILSIGFLFAWYAKDLPRPDNVRRSDGLSTVIVDRNGERLFDIFENENRIPVQWENVPQYLKDATVAIEDKEFYRHQGLSSTGIARALINIFIFRNFQGGSTLTQQLVKNVLLTQERTLPRKIKEAVLAVQIERKYTKDEILQMYLNEAPYGGTAVGVESAAQYYFGKRVRELTLIESAVLAGFPQAPSRYSPFSGSAYIARTHSVLRRMREDGYISALTEAQAKNELEQIQFTGGAGDLRAPHFVAYIRELLEKQFGSKIVTGGGLRVTTSLDWKLQENAQKIVSEEVEKAQKLKVSNGSAVVLDPKTGEILAMVGSKDYTATDSGGFKFNVATQGFRQPGSAIKPITYAAAFKKGYTASTLIMDVDTKYPSGDPKKPEYNPKNYDDKFRGPVQLRYALGNSINTIAVKVSALVGIREILTTAYAMGLSTLEPTQENITRLGLSLTLGGGEVTLLELTSAFGVLADSGLRQDPVSILKVEDAKGKIIYEHKEGKSRRVLPEDVSYLVTNILSDNEARREVFGTRSHLVIGGKTVAAKTGTTDDKRDNWAIGYTPSIAVGTWVGNNDNSPMHPSLASGITGAAPIWNRIMREAIKDKPDEPFVRPQTIIETEVDAYGGGLPVEAKPRRKEIFIKGTEPTESSSIYQTRKVSRRDSNKLANSVEIAKGEYDNRSFIVLREEDPVSTDGKNRWQEGINAWLAGQNDSIFHPPTEVYQGSEDIVISIKEPGDTSQVNDNNVKVSAEAGSVGDITKIELYLDGTLVKEKSSGKISETITMTNGNHTIKAKAYDNSGRSAETQVRIGVNQPYTTPTPSPTLTSTPTPTP